MRLKASEASRFKYKVRYRQRSAPKVLHPPRVRANTMLIAFGLAESTRCKKAIATPTMSTLGPHACPVS